MVAFNKEPDAALMTMERPGLTVRLAVGDLFETVERLVRGLGEGREPA